MQYRKLGNSDVTVSAVTLGTWAMGNDFFGKVDDGESIRAIRAAIDNGITMIDTAPAYGNGHAEEVVGKAIQGRRDEVVVATKVGIVRTPDGGFANNLKPESVRKEIDDSLRRLGIDAVDLYLIHWPDPDTPLADTLEELERIQEAGKFRYLGVSNFSPDLMEECRRRMPVVATQPQYSLLSRDAETEIIKASQANNIATMGYGTLAGGILTGKYREIPTFDEGDYRAEFYDYFREPLWSKVQKLVDEVRAVAKERGVTPAQVAINWAIRPDFGVTTALVGAKNERHAASNASAAEWMLTPAEIDRIESAQHTAFG